MKRLSLFLIVSLALHLALQLVPNFLLREPDVQLQASITPISVRTMVMNSEEPVEEEAVEEPEEIGKEPEPEPVEESADEPEPRQPEPTPEPEETVGKAEPDEVIEEPEPEPVEEPVEPEVEEVPESKSVDPVDPNPSKPVQQSPEPVAEPVDVPPQPGEPRTEVEPEPTRDAPEPKPEEELDENVRPDPSVEETLEKQAEPEEDVQEKEPIDNPDQTAGPDETPGWLQSDPDYRHNPSPDYPQQAIRREIEGTVELLVEIDREGRVRSVELETTSGSRLLDRAAKRAVRTWEFEPRTENGTTTSSWAIVPVRFQLN